MVFIQNINYNILIFGTFFLYGYQDESEKWELYQGINVFLLELKQKTAETVVHITHTIINIF